MKLMKASLVFSLLSAVLYSEVYADEVESLPTIKVMADAELRNEVMTTLPPLQEDEMVRRTLQHYMIKKEQGIQNQEMTHPRNVVNVQPMTALPEMSHLSPIQQEYVLAVAAGFRSFDPGSGIFKMLEPLGIDRDRALNHVQNGGGPIQLYLEQQRLGQLLGDQWRGGAK